MQINTKKIILGLSFFCGLLFIGVSIPLIMGMIEPNGFYGIQLEKDPSNMDWYELNRIGGWAMVASSISMMIGTTLLYMLGKKLNRITFTLAFAGIFLGSVLIASIVTSTYVA